MRFERLILSFGEPSGVGADGTGVRRCAIEGSFDSAEPLDESSFVMLGSCTLEF